MLWKVDYERMTIVIIYYQSIRATCNRDEIEHRSTTLVDNYRKRISPRETPFASNDTLRKNSLRSFIRSVIFDNTIRKRVSLQSFRLLSLLVALSVSSRRESTVASRHGAFYVYVTKRVSMYKWNAS